MDMTESRNASYGNANSKENSAEANSNDNDNDMGPSTGRMDLQVNFDSIPMGDGNDSNSGNKNKSPSPKKRKRYPDNFREMLYKADCEGGRKKRLEVAHMIGMPESTADNIVYKIKWQLPGGLHDSRTDKGIHHGGRHSKRDDDMTGILLHLLHFDSTLTLEQTRIYLNQEMLKRMIKENGGELSSKEEEMFVPVENEEQRKTIPGVLEQYERQEVKAPSTIRTWMTELVYSSKYKIREADSVNSLDDKAARITFASSLMPFLNDSNKVVIFVDETPYFMSNEHGWKPNGKQVSKSSVGMRAQLCIAVSPDLGLVHGESILPPYQTFQSSHRPQWGHFLNQFMWKLVKIGPQKLGQHVEKLCIVLCGNHQVMETENAIRGCQHFHAFAEMIRSLGIEVVLTQICPNSPQLNLCEYYDRAILSQANELRDLILMENRENQVLSERSKKQLLSNHIHVLQAILQTCVDPEYRVHGKPLFDTKLYATNLRNAFHNVIENEGYLYVHGRLCSE